MQSREPNTVTEWILLCKICIEVPILLTFHCSSSLKYLVMLGYVYILLCSDGSLYTGSTTNLENRLILHHKGKAANHTRKRLPVQLKYVEEFGSISQAFQREKQIQKWSRKKKNALIQSEFNQLKVFSKKSF